METIKNYLEAMFASMPNTAEVKKAKAELFQMMEDKYNELIADGVSENTAVGTVISEFGNLDELAEDLGLTKEITEVKEREATSKRRFVSMDEAKAYLAFEAKSSIMVGLGVLLCIVSVNFPIVAEFFDGDEKFGVFGLFLCIACAVGLFVYNGVQCSEWSFLKKEPCQIDMATAEYVKERRSAFKTTRAMSLTLGVLLCAFCWVPCAIVDIEIMAVFLFISVGLGVLLIIYSSCVEGSFELLLKLNDKTTVSGSYGEDESNVKYVSKWAQAFMEVYWATVTCLYLIISFVTGYWHISWIIWVIAWVVRKALMIVLTEEEE
ncbi:MAG: permease prefix domain 1-containing protein [Lachnospiraceae bacterium]|nr:permease prefix domain 1-containing protein [Lachnospiraceae bacterium]